MTTPDFAAATSKRIEGLLMPGEIVRYAGRRHWLSYQRAFSCFFIAVLGIITTLMLRHHEGPIFVLFSSVQAPGSERILAEYAAVLFLLLGTMSAITTAILNWTLIMAITSRRIILRLGLVARDTTDLPLGKIDIVMIDQGVLDRITGCGTVVVRTISESTTSFAAITQPTAFRNAIISAMEDAADQSAKAS